VRAFIAEEVPMQLWRASLTAAVAAAALALLAPSGANGQDKSKDVSFKSADGVTLQGTFYPAGKNTKDNAVVLLLHDFDSKKGGSSSQDGWGELAGALQKAGYAVLSFDFRGFGNSKEVNKDTFWDTRKYPYNSQMVRKSKALDTIDHKNFGRNYYAYLVNDVAAAKAFLDRANDRKEVNSSNLLIIGAGQGATVGAAWLYHEALRKKDKVSKQGFRPNLGDPEVKDVAGCVWLSISSGIEGRATVPPNVKGWLAAAAKTNKVPMTFYYGDVSPDKTADPGKYSTGLVTSLKALDKNGDVRVKAVPVKGALQGSKLLDKDVIYGDKQKKDADKGIVKWMDLMLDLRGSREQLEKKIDSHDYWYDKGGRLTVNKKAGEEVPPVRLSILGLE